MSLFGRDAKTAEAVRVNSYQKAFGTAFGRDVLLDLAEKSGFFEDLFVPNDPTSTAFNNGRRSLFLEILKATGTNVDDVLKTAEQLAAEMNEREKNGK